MRPVFCFETENEFYNFSFLNGEHFFESFVLKWTIKTKNYRFEKKFKTMSIGNCSHIVVCGCSQIEIHHLHSQETIVADALSRPEPNTVQQHPPTTTATTLVSTLHAPPPPAVPDYLSRRCLFFNSPTPRLSFSTYYHPCLLSLFLSPGPIFSMTCPQASSSPWFQRR